MHVVNKTERLSNKYQTNTISETVDMKFGTVLLNIIMLT